MKALPSPLSIPSTPGPSAVHVPLPCIGLTEKDDPRIAQYLKRTSVNSAGGKDIHEIALDLFSVVFKNLSKEKKDIVRQKQVQTHIWSVDRMRTEMLGRPKTARWTHCHAIHV
jgi:phosphatidylserine/phosphatidylglycerophosphate/cardiolipin synthase-like enzyme